MSSNSDARPDWSTGSTPVHGPAGAIELTDDEQAGVGGATPPNTIACEIPTPVTTIEGASGDLGCTPPGEGSGTTADPNIA